MLFGRPGSLRDLTVVDWQTVTWGPAMTDVAYFIGCALQVEDRRAYYDELLQAYHDGLGPNPPLTLDEVREGVRRQSFFGVMMSIVSSMLVKRLRQAYKHLPYLKLHKIYPRCKLIRASQRQILVVLN